MPDDLAAVVPSAFARGQAALDAGRLDEARPLLDYAHRLAPDNAVIAWAAGTLRLRQGDPGAAAILEDLARRHDLREAWLGLAAARVRQGYAAAAAEALAAVLSRHALPEDAGLAGLCDRVAAGIGAPGWCALGSYALGSCASGPEGVLLLPVGLRATLRLDGAPARLRRDGTLPPGWRTARRLEVLAGGRTLLGSPIELDRITRAEGFVEAEAGGLRGWISLPADPDRDPEIEIRPAHGATFTLRATDTDVPPDGLAPLARPRAFRVPAARLPGTGPVRVLGPDGRELYGSPLDPGAESRSAAAAAGLLRARFPAGIGAGAPPDPAGLLLPGVPADITGPPPTAAPVRRAVDVVIPVYRGLAETAACLESVLATVDPTTGVVVVDDASPEPELAAALDALAAAGRIVLLRQPRNAGFPAAANAGLRHGPDRDAVLLNSDTVVPPGWLDRLRDLALAAPDIGSVTPLSNDATILSTPDPEGSPFPDAAAAAELDRQAWAANGAAPVDIPTAVGFCMYIRRDCLDATGLLREDLFAQGYGEENDWCLRARHLGWRHVAHPGVFVAHVGGRSFGGPRMHLIRRNLRLLNRLHPGYSALIERFQAADPIAAPRRRIDRLRWQAESRASGSVILITHARGGGIARRVRERCDAVRAAGLHPIVLVPAPAGDARGCRVQDDADPPGRTPNLVFALPGEADALLDLLRDSRPRLAELHHFVGHHPMVAELHRTLGIPQDLIAHDYALFCPRIALVPRAHYCGEPDLAGCEACIADHGSDLDEDIRPTALIHRSAAWLAAARRVIAPSDDAARRMARHFPGLSPLAEPWEPDPWEPDPAPTPRPPARAGPARICVSGAVGVEKGYDVLLACARDAARRDLPLLFLLAGFSIDDARLMDTGRVQVTGGYKPGDAVATIRAQSAHLGFLPSIWPETWSYALGEMWQAGLDVVAFDLGAPAERIARTGRGLTVPLGLPPPALNDLLLRQARGRG